MGYGKDRYGQSYYGATSLGVALSAIVISDDLQAILNGENPKPIECAVDVLIGGVAIPMVTDVSTERGLSNALGRATIGILCDADNLPASIVQNAAVTITSKITFGGGTLTQQIFKGRVDVWNPPNKGQIEGQIECYDDAKKLDDDLVSGSITGDVANWISDRCAAIGMGAGFAVIQKGEPIEIPSAHNLTGYRNVLEAAKALVSAFNMRYVFFTGAGELVIFDPATAANEPEQIDFKRAIAFRELIDTDKRFNRVAYSNYVGYAHDFVTYTLTVSPDGVNSINAANVGSTPIISGVYNDLVDQAAYGVLDLSGGVQNNICSTDAELLAYAESVSEESKRRKYSFSNRFNPLLELGTTHTFQGNSYFIGKVKHNIGVDRLWTTDLEFWSV